MVTETPLVGCLSLVAVGVPGGWGVAAGALCLWGVAWWDSDWDQGSGRLAAAVRGFGTAARQRTVLHSDPRIDPLEVALFHAACEQEVEALERLFGVRLREWRLVPTRLRVYLFPTPDEVSRVHGEPAGGYAHWLRWYVVANAQSEWRELIRHEVAHLFAGRWSQTAPRVLAEGLAVWAQRTVYGRPIDSAARSVLPQSRDPIDLLLRPGWPDDTGELFDRYYVLAGSFTGFLIRRYGLATYRRFYRTTWTGRTDFARRFERHFGEPLGGRRTGLG
jgi:hypothetical protein